MLEGNSGRPINSVHNLQRKLNRQHRREIRRFWDKNRAKI